MKKLDINLLDATDEDYSKSRIKFLEKMIDAGASREKAEVKWDALYPNGKQDWLKDHEVLTSIGQQNVIDKINEIIDHLNKPEQNTLSEKLEELV